MQEKILVVEDDSDIRELIHFNLFKAGYNVILAHDGAQALQLYSKESPDLILLDLMVPEIAGLEVCEIIREKSNLVKIPIIIVTAKGDENDIVKGLEAGADDYITKPFSPKILLARIKIALGHYRDKNGKGSDKNITKINDISIDNSKKKVIIGGEKISLTYSEFEILLTLAKKPGWVFTRSQLVELVRGQQHAITDRSVDVHIVGLRKKMGERGSLIESVRGVGYKMREEV